MDVSVSHLSVTSVALSGKIKIPQVSLQDVNFQLPARSTTALMAPPGAGRKTLLSRLLGRGAASDGTITFNGKSFQKVRNVIGYFSKEDIVHETLTVLENLWFAALFTQNRKYTSKIRVKKIEETINKIGLQGVSGKLLGSSGLSLLQRRLTRLGMILLCEPKVIIMDGPLNGLDAQGTKTFLDHLMQVAESCTILASMHQPSEAAFCRFQRLLLLDQGNVAFFGLIKGLRELITTIGFQAYPGAITLPDLVIHVLEAPINGAEEHKQHCAKLRTSCSDMKGASAGGEETPASRKVGKHGKPADKEQHDPHPACNNLDSVVCDTSGEQKKGAPGEQEKEPGIHKRRGCIEQYFILVWRAIMIFRHSRVQMVHRLVSTLLCAVLTGWLLLQVERDMMGVTYRMYGCFFLAWFHFLFAMLGEIAAYPKERVAVLHELRNRIYNPVAFCFAKVTADIFLHSLFPILTLAIGYPMIGLSFQWKRLLFYFLYLCLLSNVGAALGVAVFPLLRGTHSLLLCIAGLTIPQLVLSGIFIPYKRLSQPFQSLTYINPSRYALQGLMTNEFTACQFENTCKRELFRHAGGLLCKTSPKAAKCPFCCSSDDLEYLGGYCPVLTCGEALEHLGLAADSMWPSGETNEDIVWNNAAALVTCWVIFRTLGLGHFLYAHRCARTYV